MELPNGFVAIIDTREKKPYKLAIKDQGLPQVTSTLKVGDYSVQGYEDRVAIERKSLIDFLGCVGIHRVRFEKEIAKLEAYEVKALVIEASWRLLENGNFMTQVHPNAAVGSLLSWIARGIPVVMVDNRERGKDYVSRILIHAYRRFKKMEIPDLSSAS